MGKCPGAYILLDVFSASENISATMEAKKKTYSQWITLKHFQQQFTVLPHNQTLLRNTIMEERYFTFLLK